MEEFHELSVLKVGFWGREVFSMRFSFPPSEIVVLWLFACSWASVTILDWNPDSYFNDPGAGTGATAAYLEYHVHHLRYACWETRWAGLLYSDDQSIHNMVNLYEFFFFYCLLTIQIVTHSHQSEVCWKNRLEILRKRGHLNIWNVVVC